MDKEEEIASHMSAYFDSSVSSVPLPTLMKTSSMVVTDTPKLLIPKSTLRATYKEHHDTTSL